MLAVGHISMVGFQMIPKVSFWLICPDLSYLHYLASLINGNLKIFFRPVFGIPLNWALI